MRKKRKGAACGTVSKYTNQRCRCAPCRAANADWQREYKQRMEEKGLCHCGRPMLPDRWYCAVCLIRQRDCQRRLRAARKNQMEAK